MNTFPAKRASPKDLYRKPYRLADWLAKLKCMALCRLSKQACLKRSIYNMAIAGAASLS